ncbi:PREDICTED: F-box protein At1g30790-like [Camelina sativa]|uniref:F-box protein At1g30790-like n=1 Tax=Camelina sativa TaxID=90675 RepID=A0ABM0YGX3_CAMSA|nr:PREDICTED: F-box protein At1g30790-like [Camelina sativa]
MQSNSVRGFVCCTMERRFVVCNPTTTQFIVLPEDYNPIRRCEDFYVYLGYDPSNDEYKVLRLEMAEFSDTPIEHSVCTLGGGSGSYSWRRIKSSILYYYCYHNGVCIDGVVYYEANLDPDYTTLVVSSFDVASEQLRVIETPEIMVVTSLTNYLGKLAAYDFSEDITCFVLWVLDDGENQVWSKKMCVFSSFTRSLLLDLKLHFVGVTAAGEIVYVPDLFTHPFELLFYHVEKKLERRVRVEGLVGDVVRSCTSRKSLCFASVSCCYFDNLNYL